MGIDDEVPPSFLPTILGVGVIYLAFSLFAYLRDDLDEYMPPKRVRDRHLFKLEKISLSEEAMSENLRNVNKLKNEIEQNKNYFRLIENAVKDENFTIKIGREEKSFTESEINDERIRVGLEIASDVISLKSLETQRRKMQSDTIRLRLDYFIFLLRVKRILRFLIIEVGVPISMILSLVYIWVTGDVPILCHLTEAIPACPAPQPP